MFYTDLPGWRKAQMMPSPKSTKSIDVKIEIIKQDGYDLKINVYTPKEFKKEGKFRVMLFFHAGGLVFGHPNELDFVIKEMMSLDNKLVVVAPNYRKAPEFKVKGIYYDIKTTFDYVINNFGNKCDYIFAGESAGGKLVGLLSQELRDGGYSIIKKSQIHIVLCYPHLIDNKLDEKILDKMESRKTFAEAMVGKGFDNWLSTKVVNDMGYSLFKNFKNMPSHYILPAERDYIRTEAEYYGKQMKEVDEKDSGNFVVEIVKGEGHMYLRPPLASSPDLPKKIVKKMFDSIKKRFKF